MEQILVRNLPNGTKAALKVRAERHQRSLEAKVREILGAAIASQPVSIIDLLSTPEGAEIAFEPARLGVISREVEW